MIDPDSGQTLPLATRIQSTLEALVPFAERLHTQEALCTLNHIVVQQDEESAWLRQVFADSEDLSEVVHLSTERWKTLA